MRAIPISSLLLTLSACPGELDGDSDPDSDSARTCTEIVSDFEAETSAIRSCSEASECGTELDGTSCGCTRDWVARVDADTTRFYALIEEASAAECDLGLISPCDCPEASGYACEDGTCTWNYASASM